MDTLFNENLISEEVLTIKYSGGSFNSNEMKMKDLYLQLQSIESLVEEVVITLKKNNKLNFYMTEILLTQGSQDLSGQ